MVEVLCRPPAKILPNALGMEGPRGVASSEVSASLSLKSAILSSSTASPDGRDPSNNPRRGQEGALVVLLCARLQIPALSSLFYLLALDHDLGGGSISPERTQLLPSSFLYPFSIDEAL